MTGRQSRLWLGTLVLLALGATSACGQAAAGNTDPATRSSTLDLGPLPTRATVAPVVVPSSIVTVHPSTSTPARPATTTTTAAVTSTSSTSTTLQVDPAKTSCTSVAYIGDSISLGMDSAETLPDASVRLGARLGAIGVTDLRIEVSGGRSIVETLPGQENAVTVAQRLRSDGFSGCWIIAVGTNDAANIAAGAKHQALDRISSLMAVLGSDPVVWLDAATVATSGYWAAPNMVAWNDALSSTAPAYPNLAIAAWSTFVLPQWYTSDGVHLVAAGAAARVQFVASVLLANLPSRRG